MEKAEEQIEETEEEISEVHEELENKIHEDDIHEPDSYEENDEQTKSSEEDFDSEPSPEENAPEESGVDSRKGDDMLTLEHPIFKGNADGIGIFFEGKEEQLSLKEGRISFPRFDSKGNLNHLSHRMRDQLLAEKWIDLTDYGYSVSDAPPPASEPNITKWRFKHPAADKNYPLNVKIGVFVRGSEEQVEVKDNEVVTTDPGIASVLEREGFIILSTEQEKSK